MQKLTAVALALLVLLPAAAGAGVQAGGMKLSTAHDATASVWYIDETGGGSTLAPTSTFANKLVCDFWSITNHTTVDPIHVRVHGYWTPNSDGTLSPPLVTTDYLVIELRPGETFTMDRQRKPLVGVTVADIIPQASEYVMVWGWN